MIFVSIASYKDPELKQTILSVLSKADDPYNIHIAVCQQDHLENFLDCSSVPNVSIVYYNCLDSKGAGWARNKTNSLYNGEEYFMQIDSHIEMVQGWDTILVAQYQKARAMTTNKIVFAAYPSSYELNELGERVLEPPHVYRTAVKFIEGTNILEGEASNFVSDELLWAKYLNAGFMFGDGSFIQDCPGDPDIYFWGEEILNTAKAYTLGYDMFHPSVHMCWHNYNRQKDITQHWNDADEAKRKIKWHERDSASKEKLKKLFSGEMPEYFGTVRNFQDFADYIEVNFQTSEMKKSPDA